MSSVRCPTCKRVAQKADNKVYPFCTPRCHMIDLGRWLAEDYRVPAEPADPEQLPPTPSTDDDS